MSVSSGVPQGSLLGPLPFMVLVNDVSLCLQSSKLLCFAGDMKMYAKLTSVSDAENLQEDLHRLESYCPECLKMQYRLLTFGWKRKPIQFNYVYIYC